MIEYYEYSSARWIWLYVSIMSHLRFIVNPHSMIAWMSRNVLLETHKIWSLSDCNGTRTQNHLVRKWMLNHLPKLAKWMSCVVSIYLYGACEFMFLLYQVCVSEWIHILLLPECQGTPYSKQTRYWKLKWLQRDSNRQPLSS